MTPRLSLSNTPARLAMINKAMTDTRHKKRFLLKVKERLRLKMAKNKQISKPDIEVITLDDDDSMPTQPSSSSTSASTTTSKGKQQAKSKLLKTPKTSQKNKNKRKRTLIAQPLANIVNTVSDLVNLKHAIPSKSSSTAAEPEVKSNDLKRSEDSASSLKSTASSGHGSLSTDQDVIDLESGDEEEDLNEISIIEVKEKDCHTLSFMNANTSILNATKSKEEIAVIEHIQHDVNSRESGLKQKVGHAVVYTDGSCREFFRTGENVAGIGVFWGPNDKRNVSELIDGFASANRAEIHAAIRAIKTAIEYKYEFVTVYTDSIYLIEGSKRFVNRRMPRGERCRADFAILAPLLKKINVKFKKVPAHKGIRGNEYADQLAKEVTREKIQEMCNFFRKGRRNYY